MLRGVENLLGILFPAACGGCDAEGSGLCKACRPSGGLQAWQLGGLSILACAPYEGTLRRAILAMKHGRRDVARSLGEFAAERLALARCKNTVLVPVPTTRARRAKRGFDQASLLARAVAKAWNAGFREALERRGGAQQGRNRQARLRAQPRFSWNGAAFSSADRVILVDDVVTTGATLGEAERALRESGAHLEGAIVLARTLGTWEHSGGKGNVER